jgi:hypothetical protein
MNKNLNIFIIIVMESSSILMSTTNRNVFLQVDKKTFPIEINYILMHKINLLINKFYIENTKNKIIKQSQKIECSKYVWQNIEDKELLIHSTIFTDNDKIYINYSYFKLFAHESIYEIIINNIIKYILYFIHENIHFEIHINIEGFTISAGQRYFELINSLFYKLKKYKYYEHLKQIYIYNPPSALDFFRTLFNKIVNNDDDISNKVTIL